MEIIRSHVEQILSPALHQLGINNDNWKSMIAPSREKSMGDLSLPCFAFAKQLSMAPNEIAEKFDIRVYTIGVGTKGFAPYPFQTAFGIQYQDVEVKIDEKTLQDIALLTDGKYFSGSLEDLILSRSIISLPLLRKDFVIDEYQIIEAKANGADVILLIAAILSRNEIKNFSSLANNLGLEVLLEVHNLDEIEKSIMPTIDLFGINNRNLKTFESVQSSKVL